MNERIKELVKQAEQYAIDKANESTDEDYEYSFDDDFLDIFTELIVQECEQVSLKNSHRDDDMGAIIARQIKAHFGVEE